GVAGDAVLDDRRPALPAGRRGSRRGRPCQGHVEVRRHRLRHSDPGSAAGGDPALFPGAGLMRPRTRAAVVVAAGVLLALCGAAPVAAAPAAPASVPADVEPPAPEPGAEPEPPEPGAEPEP